MSIALGSLVLNETVTLDQLKGTIVAIDIMPWLYKYLYVGGSQALSSLDGKVTSHVMGFLYLLKMLKIHEISPIICIDGSIHELKLNQVKRRISARKKVLDKYELLESAGLQLSLKDQLKKRNAFHYIKESDKDTIVCCCKFIGLPYFYVNGIEGEKACVELKKKGLADACMTLDRDAILYGSDFYGALDFKKNNVVKYKYKETLDSLMIETHELFVKAVICSGCDYTPGLKNVGPKKILKLIHQDLDKLIANQIPNYEEIKRFIEK